MLAISTTAVISVQYNFFKSEIWLANIVEVAQLQQSHYYESFIVLQRLKEISLMKSSCNF